MEKRGQATLFIVLGIILVVVVALYFIAVKQDIIPPLLTKSDASGEMAEIDEHVTDCLTEIGSEYLTQIGAQGGYLSTAPNTYRLYNDTTVSYLCWNQENTDACTNRLLTVGHMEEELTEAITEALSTCINVYDYSDDVEADGDWELTVDVNRQDVDLTLFYPVTVDKGADDTVSEEEFTESLDVPLGELYDVSVDIVNDHALYGDFDQLIYMLSKLSLYTIYKEKPYPDVLYKVKMREGEYVFQFAIQGEEKV